MKILTVCRQNDKMKERLASLGFAMALEPIPNFKGAELHVLGGDEALPDRRLDDSSAMHRKSASSHTAGRSAHTSSKVDTPPSPIIQRPAKRQRVDSPLPNNTRINLLASRDVMPPPPKPLSKMQSMRKMFPTIRKKLSLNHSVTAPDSSAGKDDNVEMIETGNWQDVDNRQDYRKGRPHDDLPYMSGALPVEHPLRGIGSQASQMLDARISASDFTFRAPSPVKGDAPRNLRPVQLPTEPSYIRLMDGLSREPDMELGLKDPRAHEDQSDRGSRQVMTAYQDQGNYREPGIQRRCELGNPLLHQSPHGSNPAIDDYLHPSEIGQTNGYFHRPNIEPTINPVTPAFRRPQQSGHQIQSVVSPFFDSSPNAVSSRTRAGFAEHQDSSNRFGGCQSRESRGRSFQRRLQEPPSLNGLSFFDSPVNSRNEVIQYSRNQAMEQQEAYPQHYYRSVNSRAYVTRPDQGLAPFLNGNVYNSSQSRNPSSTYRSVQASPAVPFSSSRHPRQLPSAMPSSVTGQTPVRARSQWETLQRAGVRSSRHTFDNIGKSTYVAPRDAFSTGGRRSIRR